MLLQEHIDQMRLTGSIGSRVEFNSFICELNKVIKIAERNYRNAGLSGIKKETYK